MTSRWEFSGAGRIVFGPGVISELPSLASGFGRRAFLVHGHRTQPAEALRSELERAGLEVARFAVPGEPELGLVTAAVARARAAGSELVISLGGGSVLDVGKAVAGLLSNGGEPLDYLETLGRGQAFPRDALPHLAVPTTAGTGSEVTRNAVLTSPAHRRKVSMRGRELVPRVAVVDPGLCLTLPPALTATTGLDALTQLLEAFVSLRANPLTDGLCREGLRRAARSLPRACQEPDDLAARTDMCLASLLSGLALAHAGLGAVHGLAGVLGGRLGAPHGAVCAALLPHVFRVNTRALRARAPGSPALPKLAEAARLATGRGEATPDHLADSLQELVRALGVPGLGAHGLQTAEHAEIAAEAATASSMRGNPVSLAPEELVGILEAAA